MGERQLLAWRKGYLCRRALLMICWNGVPSGIARLSRATLVKGVFDRPDLSAV